MSDLSLQTAKPGKTRTFSQGEAAAKSRAQSRAAVLGSKGEAASKQREAGTRGEATQSPATRGQGEGGGEA